ncbi:hypothetical protein [Nostoc sp.]
MSEQRDRLLLVISCLRHYLLPNYLTPPKLRFVSPPRPLFTLIKSDRSL